MMIRPKNYNEVMRLAACQRLKMLVRGVDDEMVERAYRFIEEDPGNRVMVADDVLRFVDRDEQTVDTVELEANSCALYLSLLLQGQNLSGQKRYTPSFSRSFSGDGGDGGSSGNNNNNNNNNNNG